MNGLKTGRDDTGARRERPLGRRIKGLARLRTATALAVTISVLLPSSAVSAPPSSCTLVPEVAATTVNQGLGSYTLLVRGKDTLVRFFLRMPSCAGQKDSIALTGASLQVTLNGTVLGQVTAPLQSLSPAPTIARADQAAMIDHPGDPAFLVDGSVVAPSSTTASFTPTFRATLTFTTSKSSSPQVTSPAGVTRTFESLTNALRTLIVGLGNPAAGTSQLTASGNAAMQSGMSTLARTFPVPDGTSASLAEGGATGGIRYSINPNVLDISSVMSGGTFCGTSSAFNNTIQPLLADFRQQYNAANSGTEREADRVMGALDEALHAGGSCALGYAMLGSAESYTVAAYSSSPSSTGSTATMESAHTFAQVDSSSPNYDPFNQAHSYRTEADATDPNRGYNLSTGAHISSDRTAMRVTSGWNGETALIEQHEYDALRCALGGTTSCPAATAVGTPVAVAAGAAYVAVGTTEAVLDTFAAEVPRTTPDHRSSRQLVFEDASGGRLGTFGVPVLHHGSLHDEGPDVERSDTGVFSVAAPLPDGTAAVTLMDGADVVYRRVFNSSPRVTSFTALPGGTAEIARFTSDSSDDADPALSPHGLVAWVRAGGDEDALLVAPVDGEAVMTVPTGSGKISDPAWSQDGRRLAYVQDGHLFVVSVERVGEGARFGKPQILRFADDIEGLPSASHPTWSQDRTEIAFEAGGRVYVLNVETKEERVLANRAGREGQPSWSATPGVNRIAIVRSGECESCDSRIVTVDPNDPGAPPPPVDRIFLRQQDDVEQVEVEQADVEPEVGVADGEAPSWGDSGLIAFIAPGDRLAVVQADGTAKPRTLTDGSPDSAPSMQGSNVAFDRLFLECFGPELCASQREVMLARTSADLVVEIEDETPDLTRASFFTYCRNEYQPFAVAVRPASSGEGRASFLQPYAPIGCEGARVFVDVNDGASRSGLTETTSAMTFGVSARPVPSIHSPVAGAELLEGQTLLAQGSATDGEDGDVGDLRWTLTCGSEQRTADGREPRFAAPLPPGTCTLSLTATDSDGNAETASVSVDILADRDNDWLSDELEQSAPCFPDGAESDGTSGLADDDGDGVPNVDDRLTAGGVCSPEASYGAQIVLNPKTLNPDSMGNFITAEIRVRGRRLQDVLASTVRVSNISGYDIPATDHRFYAQAWRIEDGRAIAKFSRDATLALVREKGLRGRELSFDIVGGSLPTAQPAPFTFSGTGFTRVLQ